MLGLRVRHSVRIQSPMSAPMGDRSVATGSDIAALSAGGRADRSGSAHHRQRLNSTRPTSIHTAQPAVNKATFFVRFPGSGCVITPCQTAAVTAPTAPPMNSITTPTLHPTRFTTGLRHPTTIIHPHDPAVNSEPVQPARKCRRCGRHYRSHAVRQVLVLAVARNRPVLSGC